MIVSTPSGIVCGCTIPVNVSSESCAVLVTVVLIGPRTFLKMHSSAISPRHLMRTAFARRPAAFVVNLGGSHVAVAEITGVLLSIAYGHI